MIHDKLQRLGSWSLTLDGLGTDEVDRLEYFGRVLVIPGHLENPDTRTADELAAMADYAGVLRERTVHPDDPASVTIAGAGMAFWLGDEDGKGPVWLDPGYVSAGAGFDFFTTVAIMMLLCPDLYTTFGAVTNPPSGGNFVGQFSLQSFRQSLDYLCGLYDDTYWRANPDGSLDAGPDADLFITDPTSLIVRRAALEGGNLDQRAVAGQLQAQLAADDYTSQVVLVGETEGATVVVDTATAVSNPYTALDGSPFVSTRLVREALTDQNNAPARAQLALNRFNRTREALTLSSSTHEMVGRVKPGDMVNVYDPDTGLVGDGTTQVDHKGQLLTPTQIQVVGVNYPVTASYTVVYVHGDGTVTDLSDKVRWETGNTKVEVGDYARTLSGRTSPEVAASVSDATGQVDTLFPAQVVIDAILTGTYQAESDTSMAYLIVEWTPPTNTDGSAITDGSFYEVNYRETGTTAWRTRFVGWGVGDVEIDALSVDTSHDVRMRAVDTSGNKGAWSATSVVITAVDTTPPSTPSVPLGVAGNPLSIQVLHDLTRASDGQPLEPDLALLEIHVGTTSGFAPNFLTEVGKIQVAGALAAGITVVGSFPTFTDATRYVKIIAVDRSGNASAASAAATVNAELIDTAYITDAAITNAKIGDAEITNAKIADAEITNAKIADAEITNAKIADLSASKITAGTITAAAITIGATGAIQSDNFVAGLSEGTGWRLTDTLAELNDVTVRGAIDIGGAVATSFHVNVAGQLWSGAAAFASAPFKVNNNGDVDMADADVAGDVTLVTGGRIRTAASGHRTELATGTFGFLSDTLTGVRFFTGHANEDEEGKLAITDGGTSADLWLYGPDYGGGQPYVRLNGSATGGFVSIVGVDFVNISGQLQVESGTVGEPSIRVGVEDDTGIYSGGTDRVSIAAGGSLVGYFNPNGLAMKDGTNLSPAHAFASDPDTGIYRVTGNSLGITTGGAQRARINSNGVIASVPFWAENGSATAPTHSFTSDSDSGMYRDGVNVVAFATGGGKRFHIDSGAVKPGSDNTMDCGTASFRWNDIYATNGTIQTSDLRDKVMADDRHVLGLEFVLANESIAYRWGDGGQRIHQGYGAQNVRKALRKLGHDPADVALWTVGKGRRQRQGLRMTEMIPVHGRAITELHAEIETLRAELDHLKAAVT